MNKLLVLAISAFAISAQAQVCDVKYLVDINTVDGNDVATTISWARGVPVADLDDNTKRSLAVINLLSKVQDRGGPYEVETGEWRTCDGKEVKVAANAIMVKGVTLKDANRVNHLALDIARDIQRQRFDKRAERGDKHSWDHKKARKVQRDELGNKKN